MEENSPLWLALREAGRRVLSLGEISMKRTVKNLARWHRLILNMSDDLQQQNTFPINASGQHLMIRDTNHRIIVSNHEAPSSMDTLWLPLKTDLVLPAIEQMCSELLLAGYPGCEGCGFRENEDGWDEEMSRNNLHAFLE